tara:strand:- start:38 stop:292 length:255 start_codon:yes stop_codon:yes gene_type:complete
MVYTLYIKKHCPKSIEAVKSAKATKEKCIIVDINKYNSSIVQVVEKLKKHGFIKPSVKHNTVPIVFYYEHFIGGNDELQQKLKK